MNYFNRDYETILKLLKEKDYYTFSMHANNGSAWNRNVMYKYLGYDDFYYYTKDYSSTFIHCTNGINPWYSELYWFIIKL